MNPFVPDYPMVPFKNNSGAEVPAFGCMVITDVQVTRGIRLLVCAKPSTTFYWEFAINGPSPCPASHWGTCYTHGIVPFTYTTGTPANKNVYGPKPGEWDLYVNYPGFTVLGIENSTAKRGICRLKPIVQFLGKTTGAITGSTSSTTSYRIYTGTGLSGSDAGYTTVPAAYSKVDIDNALWIKGTFLNAEPILEPLECNA